MIHRIKTIDLRYLAFASTAIACLSICSWAPAQEQENNLTLRQNGIATRYEKLEELLLRLADVEAAENPERAALLRSAAKQSREKFVLQQLRDAGNALSNEKFSDALANQDAAGKGLAEILKLLTSEDRANRIRDEKKRIAELIKGLKRIERVQRSTRARTENGADLDKLRNEQKSIGDRGEDLKNELAEENETSADDSQNQKDLDQQDKDKHSGESIDKDQSDKKHSEDENQNKADGNRSDRPNDSDDSNEPQDGKSQPKTRRLGIPRQAVTTKSTATKSTATKSTATKSTATKSTATESTAQVTPAAGRTKAAASDRKNASGRTGSGPSQTR